MIWFNGRGEADANVYSGAMPGKSAALATFKSLCFMPGLMILKGNPGQHCPPFCNHRQGNRNRENSEARGRLSHILLSETRT